MKKQVSKSKGMSTFKKLSLGNMICGYITIAAVLAFAIIGMASVNSYHAQSELLIALALVLVIVATGVFGIAQAVEGRHYGDVFGKMTRRNVTIMLTVFMSVCVGCAALGALLPELISGSADQYIEYVFYGLCILSFIGHIITSTIIVAKAK